MGDSGVSLEDKNADRNAESEDCAHEISEGNEDSVWNWSRGNSCYILPKSLSIFCPCPGTLSETEIKGDG